MSALAFHGRLRWLKAAWAGGAVTPIVCKESIVEITRVLGYEKFNLSADDQRDLLGLYLPYAETIELPVPLPELPAICRDADDNLFLYLAIASHADCLVTGDGDLLALADKAGVTVKTITDWQAGLPPR